MTSWPPNQTYADYGHLWPRERDYIFFVSHMRSYSTLLGHLLAATDEIDGYSELHQAYDSDLDLLRMPIDVQNTQDAPIAGRYLFDKLLHRQCRLSAEFADRPDVRVILAVRTPGPTLASLIELGERDQSVKWAADPKGALRHYERRLEDVQALTAVFGRAAFIVTDDLVERTEPTLEALGRFLGLSSAIPTTYDMKPLTGLKRFGDSSKLIRSGRLRVGRRAKRRTLPSEVVHAAQSVFDETVRAALAASLVPIGEPESYLSD